MDPDYLPPATSNVWQLHQHTFSDGYSIGNAEGWRALIGQAHRSETQIHVLQGITIVLAIAIVALCVLHLQLRRRIR